MAPNDNSRYAATYGIVGDMAATEETRFPENSPASHPLVDEASVAVENESGAEMSDSDV
jgi:hypothetical protein